jgi:hypothetical protein
LIHKREPRFQSINGMLQFLCVFAVQFVFFVSSCPLCSFGIAQDMLCEKGTQKERPVTDVELLIDLINELVRQVAVSIQSLNRNELTWQPDPHGNNIAVTVWHFARWWDVLTVRAFQNKPPEDELWFARGWHEQTRYDPRGIGAGGLGALTGYTWAEVEAVPILSAPELLSYLEMTAQAMIALLRSLPEGALYQNAPGLGGDTTYYDWIKQIGTGSYRHVGEIQTLRAMRQRVLGLVSNTPAPAKVVAG